MHRSASTSRASDEFFINLSPAAAASKGSPGLKMAAIDTTTYDDHVTDTSKKDLKLPGEDFIHLIPLLLLVCAFTLWAFSHPVVDLNSTGRVEGSSIHGSTENKTSVTSPATMKELYQQEEAQRESFSIQKSG